MRASLTAISMALLLSAPPAEAQDAAQREAMLARARAAELPGDWLPPPGAPISHFTVAYAKLMCTAVFVSGMDPEFARQTPGDGNALAAVAHPTKSLPPALARACGGAAGPIRRDAAGDRQLEQGLGFTDAGCSRAHRRLNS